MDDEPRSDRVPGAALTAIRIGPPRAMQLSGQRWVGEQAAALLPALEEKIRVLCSAYEPLTIFLGGSAVHGELCGIADPMGREISLSDLDLGVLTVRRMPSGERMRIAAEVASIVVSGPSARLGFYCRDDLRRQDPTLGLVETARAGIVLGGEASWLARMGMPPPQKIPSWEARRLLANRALEWLGAKQERSSSPIGVVYAASKFHADAGAVVLLAAGAYRGGGYRERLGQIRGASLDPSCRERIEAWSAWRLEPRWDAVPGGRDLPGAAASSSLDEDVAKTARAVIRAVSGRESAESFLRARRIPGRTWARSWKRWMRAGRPPLRGVSGRDLLRTPRLLLWEAALESIMGRGEKAMPIIRRLRGAVPESTAGADQEIISMGLIMEQEGIE